MKGTRSLALAALLAAGLATRAAEPAAAQTALSACGSLTKGSYKLTRNLTTTGHCFMLNNNFITIDLNGFVITGDGGSADYGIRMNAVAPIPTGIEIRNGTITNFGTAINLPAAGNVIVERVRALRNSGDGIYVGPYSAINDNVAAENGSRGLAVYGGVASGNTASSNDDNGLVLSDGSTAIAMQPATMAKSALLPAPGALLRTIAPDPTTPTESMSAARLTFWETRRRTMAASAARTSSYSVPAAATTSTSRPERR